MTRRTRTGIAAPDNPVGDLIMQIDKAAGLQGRTFSRWKRGSNGPGAILYAVHDGPRTKASVKRGETHHFCTLQRPEGGTKRSDAYKKLSKLLRRIRESAKHPGYVVTDGDIILSKSETKQGAIEASRDPVREAWDIDGPCITTSHLLDLYNSQAIEGVTFSVLPATETFMKTVEVPTAFFGEVHGTVCTMKEEETANE